VKKVFHLPDTTQLCSPAL